MRALLLALLGLSCSSPPPAVTDGGTSAVIADASSEPSSQQPAPEPEPKRPYPAKVRSLRLTRSVAVHAGPAGDSPNLGTVARDTRVEVIQAKKGEGCDKRWIEIVPRGWVCESYLEPNKRAPRGLELPKLGRGTIVPGRFGKVVGGEPVAYKLPVDEGAMEMVVSRKLEGSVTVREQGVRVVDGKTYWHIGGGEWLAQELVRIHQPARHRGVRVGDETGLSLPLAFAVDRKDPVRRVMAYPSAQAATGKRAVLARTVVEIHATHRAPDGSPVRYQIGADRWLGAGDVVFVDRAKPPPLTEPGERWVDIDLDAQTLVAYEGQTPVYVTFVSTGRRKHRTETGIFRIWIKFAETTMNGQMADEPSYSMATVPWTQFYAVDIALHTAYWHDKFGIPRSHGCVNLSPRDARFLYFWTDPNLPAGWSMAHGRVQHPGSMVRVRSKDDPEPEFKGYAKKVYEARKAAVR
ncbi:MAG: L,D-transpeptidase family protein [Deltaproteobacteria bacterium]|jgi:hypothetical protein|nr:L,D-transpeptidase family protein [Deltaproteobacteria bacterium]